MSNQLESHVFLTVRGTMNPKSLDAARVLHNETAGSPPGIAAARALGDLSHKVYAPSLASKQSGAKEGELLFVDMWVNPQGIFEFFSNKHVQEQGGKLFGSRDATVWMQARGAFTWAIPAAAGRNDRYLGVIRGPIGSPEKAIERIRAIDVKAQRDARRRGLLSHDILIKMNPPGDDSPLELLGLDVWCDYDGMTEHYADVTHVGDMGGVFSGAPQPSVWEQAPGNWSEW